jgi:hypothetical protein
MADVENAHEELVTLFAGHICDEDAGQIAAQVVRKATERP